MGARLRPMKYDLVNCGQTCSLGAGILGPDRALQVHQWYEAGSNDDKLIELAAENGFKLTRGSCSRHRKNHLRVHIEEEVPEGELDTAALSDVEILREVIKRGARFIPTWKVGPNEFFKAMDMYYKLTQGSAMTDLFAALSAAAAGDDADVREELAAEVDDPG